MNSIDIVSKLIKELNNTTINERVEVLQQLNVYGEWCENVFNQNDDVSSKLEDLMEEVNFYEFITSSFNWSDTDQDQSFWAYVARAGKQL